MKQKYNLGHGILCTDTMTFTMGAKVYQLKEKSELVKFKERECAGGGWYYENRVWVEKERITQTVWNESEYIGEIIQGSSVKFKDPKRHQIKMPLPNQ